MDIVLDFARPICLPFEDNINEDYRGERFVVAGWGRWTQDKDQRKIGSGIILWLLTKDHIS